jgi:hypothetical protein
MNAKRGKLIFTFLAYIYWPAAYFGIYLPFLVPRLEDWRHIPYWIPIALGLGFIFVLANMGKHLSTKVNVLNAIGIWASILLFMLLMGKLTMPGFKKVAYGVKGRLIEELIVLVAPMLIMFAVAEGGRILLTRKARP